MKYFYARVSSDTQNLDRQIQAFKEIGATERTIFKEKKSGKSFENRQAWSELINEWAKKDDTIVVKNLDRIGRDAREVRKCLIDLTNKGIIVESIDQGYLNGFLRENLIDKKANSLAEAMLNVMLDTMLEVDLLRAEWERKELRRRQREGVERALSKGVKFGRNKDTELRERFKEVYPLTRNKNDPDYISVKEALEAIGCSKAMFYKMKKEDSHEI